MFRLYFCIVLNFNFCMRFFHMDRVKRIWFLSPMRAAKVQASLRIRAVSPEPSLLAHISSESRGTFRQKASSLAPLNGWACAVKICHDGMLEDTNSLDGAHIITTATPRVLHSLSEKSKHTCINVVTLSIPMLPVIIRARSWELTCQYTEQPSGYFTSLLIEQ